MSTQKVPTKWQYSLQTEAENVLRTAHQMATNFYRINGFYVLPLEVPEKQQMTSDVICSLAEAGDKPVVWMPRLPYHQISRFWEYVRKLQYDDKVDETVLNKVAELLAESEFSNNVTSLIHENAYQKPPRSSAVFVKSHWGEAQKEIWEAVYTLMPQKRGSISKLIIHPTLFGTTVKFYSPQKPISVTDPFALRMYLRIDQDIYAITEAILTALTRYEIYQENDGLWAESEYLVDWLLTKSAVAKVLQKYAPETRFTPTLSSTRRKQDARLWEKSERFYGEIGLGKGKNVEFRIEDVEKGQADKRAIYFSDQKLHNLTDREVLIFTLLIHNREAGVSYDELAEVIFDEYDDFSLYAISKAIQRLRDKLEANGFTGSYIQTKRGFGYALRS